MKRQHFIRVATVTILIILFSYYLNRPQGSCLTGAFLADSPTAQDITEFKNSFGKKPYLVMIFIDWPKTLDKKIIADVYSEGCVLFVTWEPWRAERQRAVNYDNLLSGRYDRYIAHLARQIAAIGRDVYIRFGHEMNGDWYPWSGERLGADKFIAVYQYVKDVFDKNGAENAKWVFSVNWEDVPKRNNYTLYYPGDAYVDYIGIDGYNWGDTQEWSRWMSFKEIFRERYEDIVRNFKKPVIISEFSSSGSGGDKAAWAKEALDEIRKMKRVRAFVLFNVDKETNWRFKPATAAATALKQKLSSDYFRDVN